MERRVRRILLAVEPGLLEGALARLLSVALGDKVVVARGMHTPDAGFDAAVVSDDLPEGVQADVVITLPDTRGSGGLGSVRSGQVVQEVSIPGAERVVELLEQYVRPA